MMNMLKRLPGRVVKLEGNGIIHASKGSMRCFSFSMRFSESEDDDTDAAQSDGKSVLRTQEIQRIRGIGGSRHPTSPLLLIESHRGNKDACAAIAATISKYRPQTLIVPIPPDSPMACKYFTPKGISLPGEAEEEQLDDTKHTGSDGPRRAPTRRRKYQRRKVETRRSIDGLIEGMQNRMDQIDIGVDVGSARDFIENVILPQKDYTDSFLSALVSGNYDREKLKQSERRLMQRLYVANPSPESLDDLTLSGELLREYAHGPLFRRKENTSFLNSKYSVIYSKFEGSEELHRIYEDSLSAIFQAVTRNHNANVVFGGMPTWALWLYLINSRSKVELRELLLEIKSQARAWDEVYPLLHHYAPDVDEVRNLYSATVEQFVMGASGITEETVSPNRRGNHRKRRTKKTGNLRGNRESQQTPKFQVISLAAENQFDGAVNTHEKLRYMWDAWQYDGERKSNRDARKDSGPSSEKSKEDYVQTPSLAFRDAMNGSVSSNDSEDSSRLWSPEIMRYDYHSRNHVDTVATYEALKLYGPGVRQAVDPRWYLSKLKSVNKHELDDEGDIEDEPSRKKILETLGERKSIPVIPGKTLTERNLNHLLKCCTLQLDATGQYSRSQLAMLKHPGIVANRLQNCGKVAYQLSADDSYNLPNYLHSQDSRQLSAKLDKLGRLSWAFASSGPRSAVAQADPCMSTDFWQWWIKPFKVFPAYLLAELFDESCVASYTNAQTLRSELDAMYRVGRGYTAQQRDLDDDPLRGSERIKSKYSTLDPEDREEINEMKNEWQNHGYPHMRFRSQH
eukprot:gb/GECG01001832.1/.p1 GENE.gb/GECG01001832.1/~~gb/GECG01001832.1/.p1  ORF type:complete len:795 (+),score=75.11 gb/GECG01001832.1/:1-2385(+)